MYIYRYIVVSRYSNCSKFVHSDASIGIVSVLSAVITIINAIIEMSETRLFTHGYTVITQN